MFMAKFEKTAENKSNEKLFFGGKRSISSHYLPKPYITIITAAYNAHDDLQKTMSAIAAQLSSEVEWIIVDGASQDGSIDFYQKNSDLIDLWISEPDNGIYDAWNKGLKHASGDWVLFLGAGDYFASENTLEVVAEQLRYLPPSITFAYGGIFLVNENMKKLFTRDMNPKVWDLGLPALPPHPAVFQRSELFFEVEPFDKSYKISGDSKFMLLHANNNCFRSIDTIVTCMLVGGVSSRPESWLTIREEKLRIRHELGIKPPPWFMRIQDIKLYIKPLVFKILGSKTPKFLILFQRFKKLLSAN